MPGPDEDDDKPDLGTDLEESLFESDEDVEDPPNPDPEPEENADDFDSGHLDPGDLSDGYDSDMDAACTLEDPVMASILSRWSGMAGLPGGPSAYPCP